ncbi:MAG: nucleotidyltransferase family protein [Candidatus Pacearchaeota archaeon]
MVYTEIKVRNGERYYYRVRSMRRKEDFKKKRIYLGKNLSVEELEARKERADKKLLEEKIKKSLSEVEKKIVNVLKKYKVKRAGIFGSYSRGEQKENSDIDILIEPPRKIGFGFVKIVMELEEKLGKKVDLLSYNGIDPLLKNKILSQEIKII